MGICNFLHEPRRLQITFGQIPMVWLPRSSLRELGGPGAASRHSAPLSSDEPIPATVSGTASRNAKAALGTSARFQERQAAPLEPRGSGAASRITDSQPIEQGTRSSEQGYPQGPTPTAVSSMAMACGTVSTSTSFRDVVSGPGLLYRVANGPVLEPHPELHPASLKSIWEAPGLLWVPTPAAALVHSPALSVLVVAAVFFAEFL